MLSIRLVHWNAKKKKNVGSNTLDKEPDYNNTESIYSA